MMDEHQIGVGLGEMNNMARQIRVIPMQQPTPVTCVHTCLAMVTGESIDALVDRFGNHGLSFDEEATVLVEHGIFPVITTGQSREFPGYGVYLVSTASLNLPGRLHRLVVEVTEDEGFIVHDPNTGRGGVQAYARDSLTVGDLHRAEVAYLDTRILRNMKRGK
jgi:hypothetical protein